MDFHYILNYVDAFFCLVSAVFFNRTWTHLVINYGKKYKYLYDWKIQYVPVALFICFGAKISINLLDPMIYEFLTCFSYLCLATLSLWVYNFHKKK